jgi:hypothetical protein
MLNTEINRLRYFLQNDPTTIKEVTECVNLAMQRASEISLSTMLSLDTMPTQLKGEIGMLKQLADHALNVGEMITLRQRTILCEQMIRPVLDVSLLGTSAITVH